MSAGQENAGPPVSRLPRLASSPSKMSSIPSIVNNKRKTGPPSAPLGPIKRQALSTSVAPALRQSQRNEAGGFRPTSRKAVSTNITKQAAPPTVQPSSSIATRPVTRSRLASATNRPPTTRSASAAATTSTSWIGKTADTVRSASVAGPSGSRRGANVQTNPARINEVEDKLDMLTKMLAQENANASQLKTDQIDKLNALLTRFDTDKEARRGLSSASEEMAELQDKHAREVEDLERQINRKDRERRSLEEELKDSRAELGRERDTNRQLRKEKADQSLHHTTLNAQLIAAETQISVLKQDIQRAEMAVSQAKADLAVGRQKADEAIEHSEKRIKAAEEERDARIAQVEDDLRAAETIRRKLHNQVQELKGNIRVFARVRPALPHESNSPDALADIGYGDERVAQEKGESQITVTAKTESATGKEREQVANFTFDKIFQPRAGQKEVFEEISMLAQSVLDGYNVCIFAYGQTGSGKSWTMEGGQTDADLGMIPRAIDMIFRVSSQLKDRGWRYQMEGQFLEVYNEVINDLLGNGQFDTKKHEIKFDREGKMSVTETVSIPLSNARQVGALLDRARSRRAVAATLMNERSSRSHSVFTLKVRGENPLTDEKCEAMLNLVDLAGSERLASSGAGENKDRLKETININKSLSALADVIGALGTAKDGGHVPYRNSTLTRLLQTSLSGSSKTLMLCNLSPLAAHLGETLCSLRFATKVNTTSVGAVKKQVVK